jgi:hypothetical protein
VSALPPTGNNGPGRIVGPPIELDRADRIPHSIPIEQGLLGALLLAGAPFVERVREILPDPNAFFRAGHAELYGYILELHAAGTKICLATVEEDLHHRNRHEALRGIEFLAELIERGHAVTVAADAVYYAEIVREHARKRAILEGADEIRREVLSNGKTADQIADFVSRRLGPALVESADETGTNLRPWPEPLSQAAYHGVAGEIIRLIAPHTEADAAAILVQFLVGFGSVIGRDPHWRVESTRHSLNLYAVVVGNSSKARKGTSWDNVRWILGQCDHDWADNQVMHGLSSGEGLIWTVRDPIIRRVKAGDGFTDQEIDPGVSDKRAMFVETEFGRTLGVMARDGNNLSDVLRQGWDSGRLASSTKNSPAKSTGAHISVIGHITIEDLAKKLSRTDAANGFANRFLWVLARRSQYLPHGGRIHEVNFTDVVNSVRDAAVFGKTDFGDGVPLLRDAAANAVWESVYPMLSDPRPGLLGAVTCRAEAQVMRLAAIYAILDQSRRITVEHLSAGLEVWRYSEESASYVFGDSMGDPDAERLLEALRDAGPEGLTLTQIRRQVFCGRASAELYKDKLASLARTGLASVKPGPKDGKTQVWIATSAIEFLS